MSVARIRRLLDDSAGIGGGLPTVDASAIPYGADEPYEGKSGVTTIFTDDLEAYSDRFDMYIAPFGSGHWRVTGDEEWQSIDATKASDGSHNDAASGKSIKFTWPAEATFQQDSLLYMDMASEFSSTRWSGRVGEVFAFDYFADIPDYGAGKKHCLFVGGDGADHERWTINENVFSLSSIIQTCYGCGGYWDWYPGVNTDSGDTPAEGDNITFRDTYLNDGRWHRYTFLRVPETSNGSADGQLHIWFDGNHVVERYNLATGSSNTVYLQVCSTFNGPHPDDIAEEWFDNFAILEAPVPTAP